MHQYSKIFQSLQLNGSIRIRTERSKLLEYNPLHDEISLKQNDNKDVTVTVIKNGKKMLLRLKSDSEEHIKNELEKNLPLLEIGSIDEDNEPLEIIDTLNRDLRTFEYDSIDGYFLLRQWKTVKNYPLPKSMSIESFSYQVEETENSFYNSYGSEKHQQKNNCSYAVEYFYDVDGFSDIESRYRSMSTLEPITDTFLGELKDALLARSRPVLASFMTGTYTIALENKLVAEFLEKITESLSAENIRQKQSLFSFSELGSSVFDTRITLKNNPFFEGSAYNSYFDIEGVTTKPTFLIENGIMRNLLVDMKNSRKLSLPIGNSSITNLILESHETVENPLKNAKFLFTNLMAFHTIDMMTGKFALEGEGFEIIDGKKTGFIKNIALSSNIRDLFRSVDLIGIDTFKDANIFCPTISFKNQMIVI